LARGEEATVSGDPPTQAVLPEHLEDPTIDNMTVGQVAYTMSWAMSVDSARRCWLNPRYPAFPEPGGTVKMRLQRRDDGFHVWIPQGETWSVPEGYADSTRGDYLPVVKLHFDPDDGKP
jgi:hypothetical protein